MRTFSENKVKVILALILVVAAMFRLYGLNWDQGQHAHPDERWIAMVAPSITWPRNIDDLLNPRRSTLNPLWNPQGQQVRNFAYGHLPLYLHALVGHTLAALGEQAQCQGELSAQLCALDDYGAINLVGRALSVLFDLGTIYLVFLLGRRVYSEGIGLLGAALVSLAVTHIQLAHFSTFDVITTFFVIASVYGSVRVVQAKDTGTGPTVWAGAAAGLAIASKFSAIPLLAVLVLAQILRATKRSTEPERPPVLAALRRSWLQITLSLAVAALAFILTSPFAILDWKLYLKQIIEQSTMVRGTADWPFTRQYINTTPFLYQITQQVRWGLDWPLGITAFAGFGWTLVRQMRRPRPVELVMLGWAIPYFLITGSFMVKFMRYMLPVLPLFILMGAAMLKTIANWAYAQLAYELPHAAQYKIRNTALRFLAALPVVITLVVLPWPLAFMRVYAQTHPWIQASRWIYANIPDGSTLAVEHWDDHLPLSLPEPNANPAAHSYAHVILPMYEPDTYDKMLLIRDRLRAADFIVLATNRLHRTIPRLPKRYPASTEFYRLLFDGELGYIKVAEFTAYPGLFGIQIRDDDADESFTVYDHPKPLVFAKQRDLSDQEWSMLFAEALATPPMPDRQERGPFAWLERDPPAEGEEPRTLMLDHPVGELPVVDDFGWNRWANTSTVGAVLVWWAAVTALGWLAWPLVFVVFKGLRDRGYLLSRMVALLIVGYLIWLPSSLRWLKNGLPLTWAAIVVLAIVSFLLWRRHRPQMAAFDREKRKLFVLSEAIFGAAFLAFVGIRMLNPDLWQPWNGGEKLMDIAYLNACLRSAHFPPYDPYFAHGYLNYYYYGQFLVSILTRLTGIKATIAFNLAVPTLFAWTVSGAFSVGYTLAGRITRSTVGQRDRIGFGVPHGLLAALCVAVFGNMASATQVIERLGWVSTSEFTSQIPGVQAIVKAVSGAIQIMFKGAQFPGFNYWDPSRVVGPTINEFPYWSFLFADLHPHMMNLPFTVLVIALTLNWMRWKRAPIRSGLPVTTSATPPRSEGALLVESLRYVWQRIDWGEMLVWIIWPLSLGALWAINSWDWPAYAGLSGLVLLLVWIRVRGKQGVIPALLTGLALASGSLLLYLPFLQHYTAIFVGLGWGLSRGHTLIGEYLTMWTFDLFVAITLLIVLVQSHRNHWGSLRLFRLALRYPARLHRIERLYKKWVRARGTSRIAIAILSILLVIVLITVWKGYWVLVLMPPLLVLSLALLTQPRLPPERTFTLALIFTAFLILIGIELFYLKDHLDGGGAWRMNTLFKFYLQAWVMMGIAIGASLPGIWRAVDTWRAGTRWLWTSLLAILIAAAALYPLLGTPARVMDRFPGERPPIGTLDGMAFMTVGTYTWPNENNPIHLYDDYRAIQWLNENVAGTPVLAEAPIGYYREFGVRVASYTGLPTLLGMHESEQRYGWQVGQRSGKANVFFATGDPDQTMSIAQELHIQYIYIGPLERTQYPQAERKFERLADRGALSVAYQNDGVTIYRVNEND